MKKRILSLLALSFLIIGSMRVHVFAAACSGAEEYGSVMLNVPSLPSSGVYTIWTRMQVPDADHSQYRLQVNKDGCFDVGGSSITPKIWTWVNFYNGDLSQKVKVNFGKTTENTLTLIGIKSGVKVDRVLFVKNDCVPVDLGSNCQSETVSTRAADTAGAVEVPPLNSGPVTGVIIPSATITQSQGSIDRVIYDVDGQRIPTTKNFGIDTTLLTNDTHRVAIQITLNNGRVINESTVIKVENNLSAFAPVTRWVRLHMSTVVLLSSLTGGVLILISSFFLYKSINTKKRLLKFHGF